MRILTTILCSLIAATALAHHTHRTHIVNTTDRSELRVVRDDDDYWATYKRDGVMYLTRDASVLAEIDKALEKHREISREHSLFGRRHSELGREHSQLGRKHSRLGREHSRIGREMSRYGSSEDAERRQRELEKEQGKLEEKQRALELRQQEMEREQRKLEEKQRVAERDMDRDLEQIFERAIRDGKAKRQ